MKNANIFVDVDMTLIEGMPGTVLNPFVFDVGKEESWSALTDRILAKHVD